MVGVAEGVGVRVGGRVRVGMRVLVGTFVAGIFSDGVGVEAVEVLVALTVAVKRIFVFATVGVIIRVEDGVIKETPCAVPVGI